jgi:hypothetical protein
MAGCTTSAMIKRAKGYTDARVQPLKGDSVFLHDGHSYVTQRKRPKGENAEKMSPAILQPYPEPCYAFKPFPGAYAFLLITVPFDAALLPFQAIWVGGVSLEYLLVNSGF